MPALSETSRAARPERLSLHLSLSFLTQDAGLSTTLHKVPVQTNRDMWGECPAGSSPLCAMQVRDL